MASAELEKTALHALHLEHGAKMTPFAGYDMPVQYPMGVMGEHASQQQEPRLGLAGLAQALFEAGILPEPTLAALGAFVTAELGLNVDACLAQQEAVMAAEATAAAHAACWGQASAVFARMGVMGEHASGQKEPRLGLRRLAKALFEMGLIPDDSMSSLGVFVATELGLEIAACL